MMRADTYDELAELEALLDRGARSRDEALPANVIPFRPRRARPQ